METHFDEGRWPTAMSQNGTNDRIRESYEESVSMVARMMDHVDSCYSFFDDDVYEQQIALQILGPTSRYPNIRLKKHILKKSTRRQLKKGLSISSHRRSESAADGEKSVRPIVAQRRNRQIEGTLEALQLSGIITSDPQTAKASATCDSNSSITIDPIGRSILRHTAAGKKNRDMSASSDIGTVTNRKKSPSNAIVSSLVVDVADVKSMIRKTDITAAAKPAFLERVSARKSTAQAQVLIPKHNDTASKHALPARKASALPHLPASISLLKSRPPSSKSISSSSQLAASVSVKPRPRRQASLRVSEFVRAEARLNGHDLDPHEMDDESSPSRGEAGSSAGIKDEVADEDDAGSEDYGGIFDESGNTVDDDEAMSCQNLDDELSDSGRKPRNLAAEGPDGDSSLDDSRQDDVIPQASVEPTGFSCLYCDQTFIQADAMERHIMDEHVYRSVVTPKRPMKSLMPLRGTGRPLSSTSKSSAPNRHDTIRAPPGKVVTIDSLIATHFSVARKRTKAGRRQLCMVCKKTFSSWSQLKKHLPIHSSEKPFKCPYEGCTYASVQKGNLKVHMLGVHVRRQEKIESKLVDSAEQHDV